MASTATVRNPHQHNANAMDRPIMTQFRPTKPSQGPMTTVMPAPFAPQTLRNKRAYAQVSPTHAAAAPVNKEPPKKIPKTSSLKAGHFCWVELLNIPDDTASSSKHLWWPCLLLETNEATRVFQDLKFLFETSKYQAEYTLCIMSATRKNLLDTRKINLVGTSNDNNNNKQKSLVTLLLGDQLPPGYNRSYFDNAAKTTAATGRGRRVFCAGKGTAWQDIMQELIQHHADTSPVHKAILQCQRLLQHFLERNPSKECDTSEVDLLAVGDELEEKELASSPELSPPTLESDKTPAVQTTTQVPKLNLLQRSRPQETPLAPTTVTQPLETPRPLAPAAAAPRALTVDRSASKQTPKPKKKKSKNSKHPKPNSNAIKEKELPRLPKRKATKVVPGQSLQENDSDATVETTNTIAKETTTTNQENNAFENSKRSARKKKIVPGEASGMSGESSDDADSQDDATIGTMNTAESNGTAETGKAAKSKDKASKKKKPTPIKPGVATGMASGENNSDKNVMDEFEFEDESSAAKDAKGRGKGRDIYIKQEKPSPPRQSPRLSKSSSRKSPKGNYKDTGCEVYIPAWKAVRAILKAYGYSFGKFHNETFFARPFSDPRKFPKSKLGEDYFTDALSFRSYLCAYGMEYAGTEPTPEEKNMVNRWCRYAIASDFAKPNANSVDFKLHDYDMAHKTGHSLLQKLGFQYKDKDVFLGYQWPGETKPHQLMQDVDMWTRLARFGLPKGLPLEKLKDENEVLALLICIAETDLDRREITLTEREEPQASQNNTGAIANDKGTIDDKMQTDAPKPNEMKVDGPKDDEEIASADQQEPASESDMELDSDAGAPYQPTPKPSSAESIPASQAVDSKAIAQCHQAPEAVSPRDARQNLVSSFAKARTSPAVKASNNDKEAQAESDVSTSVDAAAAAKPQTVKDFFADTTDEESAGVNETPVKLPEEPTLESWLGSQSSAKEVVLPGDTVGEKLNACLEALKINHNDELVVGGSLAASLDKIDAFLKRVIDSRGLVPDAFLHVCGGPGVGKSAGIQACIKKMKRYWSEQASKSIELSRLDEPNFLILKGSEFQNLSKAEAMAKTFENKGKKFSFKALQKPADLEESKKAAIILVLDEVDFLISKKGTEDYLREIIDLASDENKMLGIIGISNSIENAGLNNLGLCGQRVVFGTYSKDDLMAIITSKIGTGVVEGKAVELLASKVSAVSGDIRTMIGLVTDAVEACQAKMSSSKLDEPLTGPVVRMPHAIAAAKALTTKVKEVIDGLPMFERYTLCCGVNLSKALNGEDLDLEHFHRLCTYSFGFECQLSVEALSDILDRLDDKDLLRFEKPAKSSRSQGGLLQRKIRLDCQSEDVISVLEDGMEKERFFQRMKQRCQEISQSWARQSKQS